MNKSEMFDSGRRVIKRINEINKNWQAGNKTKVMTPIEERLNSLAAATRKDAVEIADHIFALPSRLVSEEMRGYARNLFEKAQMLQNIIDGAGEIGNCYIHNDKPIEPKWDNWKSSFLTRFYEVRNGFREFTDFKS